MNMKRITSITSIIALLTLGACTTAGSIQTGDSSATGTVTAAPGTTTQPISETTPDATLLDQVLELKAKVLSDVANANDIAVAGRDPQGSQCALAAAVWVNGLPWPAPTTQAAVVLPAATGAAGTAETARIHVKMLQNDIAGVRAQVATLKAVINAPLPDAFVQACAVPVNDFQVLKAKILAWLGMGVLAANPASAGVLGTIGTALGALNTGL